MNVKELEVTRNGEWLFLTPKINDNIINLSGLKNYNHTSSNNNISVNNIIDLRNELNSIKKNGYVHFYFRFNDFKQNKVYIPSNIADNDNPYFIDSIYIFNINRYKQEKRKLLYCSDINNGDDKHCFKCSPIKNVFISHLANDYWTNNKIFSPRGLPNWLYIGPSMYFNYKKDLATEKTAGLNRPRRRTCRSAHRTSSRSIRSSRTGPGPVAWVSVPPHRPKNCM